MIDSHVYTQKIDMKSYGTMEGVYINGAAKETAIRVHTIQVPGTICG